MRNFIAEKYTNKHRTEQASLSRVGDEWFFGNGNGNVLAPDEETARRWFGEEPDFGVAA